MTNAVSNAIATRNERVAASPRKLVEQYSDEFAGLLPSHVKSAMFVRTSAGALRKGRMTGGEFDLEVAARNNPQAFINALREAARLGLTPGSEEYYLTVVKNKGRAEILGIVGYQGYIELMYRSGTISSVIIETVHEGEDFDFVRGRDDHPIHRIDWYAERGALKLVYGYAKFKDGSFSRVVVLNQFDINKIKAKSSSAKSEYSPWNTDERAMWLKSAVRQLRKWVPTSSERVTAGVVVPDFIPGAPVPVAHQVQVHDPDEVVEGELVEEPTEPVEQAPEPEQPPVAVPSEGQTAPEQPAPLPVQDELISKSAATILSRHFATIGINTPEGRIKGVKDSLGVDIAGLAELTVAQADQLTQAISKIALSRKRPEEPEDVPLPDEPQ